MSPATSEDGTWAGIVHAAVGRRVAAIRRSRGLSARQLSELLTDRTPHRIKRGAISQLENSWRGCSVADLLALAIALEVPVTALVPDLGADRSDALRSHVDKIEAFVDGLRREVEELALLADRRTCDKPLGSAS